MLKVMRDSVGSQVFEILLLSRKNSNPSQLLGGVHDTVIDELVCLTTERGREVILSIKLRHLSKISS